MDELTIDPEFAALCPDQTPEELANCWFAVSTPGTRGGLVSEQT